ncbi:MAG: (2Fe-2S)-binding protein [Geminicoccaceae bacterium]|nr:(2Fe-2S)-binding protein [Geminicoccaceae bacterium]
MFRRIVEAARGVSFEFEGETVRAVEGETVAAALLAHGVGHLRDSAVTGEPRQAFCLIGACFECLVEIDGRAGRQACMTVAREGMRVRRGGSACAERSR